MEDAIESESRTTGTIGSTRLRRVGVGIVAILAVAIPAAVRGAPAAAATQRDSIAVPLEPAPNSAEALLDRGIAAFRSGEIDLVSTYRTSSEDPCLVLRRDGAGGDGDSIAMVVRLKRLDVWMLYVPTTAGSDSPRSLHLPEGRMRWRASRGVRAIALDPADPRRVVEAAASAWYAHCPPTSAGSVMTASVRAEENVDPRRFAARRTAR